MALRFDLLPFDKLFIGKSVITNSHERTLIAVDGTTPILRAKDVLTLASARNALERLYHCVQQMYLEEAREKYQGSYLALRVEAVQESPDLYPAIQTADLLIKNDDYYKALRTLKKLIRPDAFATERTPSSNYVPRAGGWKKRA